jgi:thiamine kinase-like enzyme
MELLEAWRGDACVRLGDNPWAASLLARLPAGQSTWRDAIRERSVSQALMHGDFAVWNLRVVDDCRGGGDLPGQDVPETAWDKMSQLRGGNTGLVAIDWEWAEPDGIAGIDLVHALRQEAYMVRRLPATKAIAWMQKELRKPACNDYLEKTGWNGAADDLLRLGLLHSHFNALNPSQELLAVLGLHVDENDCSGAL